MWLLPVMSKHYPAKRLWEYSNLSDRSYLDLTPNSHNLIIYKDMCSSYRGELDIILGVKGLRFSDYQFNISVAFLNISDQFRSEC